MQFVSDQYSAQHGTVFIVSRFTVMPNDRGSLRTLHFGEAQSAHYDVSNMLVELYDKMLAKQMPCAMTVGISKPLTRQQADLLNAQRATVANLTASVFAAAASPIPYGGGAIVGGGVRAFALSKLPTYHAGDVVVSMDAQVSGGIGPQHSLTSMIIKSQGG